MNSRSFYVKIKAEYLKRMLENLRYIFITEYYAANQNNKISL